MLVASFLTALTAPTAPTALAAQVGHPPSSSPYRDLPRTRGPVLAVGYLAGDRGKVDVGITNAFTLGARYDVPLGGSMRFGVGLYYGIGERFLIDPRDSAALRKTGPVKDDFLLTEVEIQLLITGNKTWHGIAPYLAAGAGFVLGGTEPAADTSDYRLGTKFMFAPGTGVRWYPIRRLNLQLDGRVVFQKLTYPFEYYQPSDDGTPVLSSFEKDNEWTRRPWLRVGLGWTF